MNIKAIIYMIFCSATLFFSGYAFATQSPGNLYVTFHNRTQDQKLYVDILDENNYSQPQHSAIQCSTQKTKLKLKRNIPSCGFGFKNLPVTISQIKYQVNGQPIMEICPELIGKKFSHGNLIIFPDVTSARKLHCDFKETH